MKKIFITLTIFLFAAGCQQAQQSKGSQNSATTTPVMCAQDVKRCPDGSYVGRIPPDCNFDLCSMLNIDNSNPPTGSGIEGTIKIGPTCPVQRIPTDLSCQDKPYEATVVVKTLDGKTVTSFTSNTFGAFKADLSPGTYILYPQMTGNLPRATSQKVTVTSDSFTQVTIYYDTGIR